MWSKIKTTEFPWKKYKVLEDENARLNAELVKMKAENVQAQNIINIINGNTIIDNNTIALVEKGIVHANKRKDSYQKVMDREFKTRFTNATYFINQGLRDGEINTVNQLKNILSQLQKDYSTKYGWMS